MVGSGTTKQEERKEGRNARRPRLWVRCRIPGFPSFRFPPKSFLTPPGSSSPSDRGQRRDCAAPVLLQWGLGENPGRNLRRFHRGGVGEAASMGPGREPTKEPAPSEGVPGDRAQASMGPGQKPRKESGVHLDLCDLGTASMGPGRKPRKELSTSSRRWPRSTRFNGAWAKTQEGTVAVTVAVGPSMLQWGLGENPGRNIMSHRRAHSTVTLQWGLGENPGRNRPRVHAAGHDLVASMGPGRKPRKEPSRSRSPE